MPFVGYCCLIQSNVRRCHYIVKIRLNVLTFVNQKNGTSNQRIQWWTDIFLCLQVVFCSDEHGPVWGALERHWAGCLCRPKQHFGQRLKRLKVHIMSSWSLQYSNYANFVDHEVYYVIITFWILFVFLSYCCLTSI